METLEEVAEGWRTLGWTIKCILNSAPPKCSCVEVFLYKCTRCCLLVPLEHFKCPLTICMAEKRSGDFKIYLTLEITPMEQIFTI